MGFKTESIGWSLSFRMMLANNGGKRRSFKINRIKYNRYVSRAAKVRNYDLLEINAIEEYNAWVKKNNLEIEERNKVKPSKLQEKVKEYNLYGELNKMQKDILEYQMYLQGQTPEQFRLAKQHGWRIAKMLTEPEPNFHYE